MSEQTLNVSEFMERVQGDKELFFELLEIFGKDFPTKRRSLEEAITNEDNTRPRTNPPVRRVRHTRKNTSTK